MRAKETQPNGETRRPDGIRTLVRVMMALILLAFLVILAGVAYRLFNPPAGGPPVFFGYLLLPFGFIVAIVLVFAVGRMLFWPWGWGAGRGYMGGYGGAKEILRRRYARGEITRDQFEQMMKDLELHQ